ncbi:ribosome hibernation-promoting factor, HPF/YfiA family [Vallicoccus soli]|uniref:Ribosome hibernation promoting factor n=1 Tax=Vallicoccus soli TaxID=2339232 RepID=A0A3A3Z4D1_9ACTN|nr:ribosome-associated translation inhibitor RaiA [Vallicoccus soli]RJK95407.1 ribosome-associated translation inhibitor RaiA [Vallicoccus soli]
MDIVVKARHCEVPDRFRKHVGDKLAKVARLDPKVITIDVEVSKEHNPRLAGQSERIEITCRTRGPVIRAEAAADDPYAALDMAWAKLEGRLRKGADRRRVHHGGKTPVSVAAATAALADLPPVGAAAQDGAADDDAAPDGLAVVAGAPAVDGDGPMVLREKVHAATPMTLEQALYEMELVGHDFFLFVDQATARPSVVYRRRAYDYGVIRLEVQAADAPGAAAAAGG